MRTTLLLLFLVTRVALADDVDVELATEAAPDEGPPPQVLVKLARDVDTLELKLASTDAPAVAKRLGPQKSGADLAIDLPRVSGHFEGKLIVKWGDGGLEYPLEFATHVDAPLTITWDAAPLDDTGAKVRLKLNRANAKVTLRAHDLDLKTLGQKVHEVKDHDPAALLELDWGGTGPVADISVEASDESGATANGKAIVLRLEIPHEDVLFDTAKHDLKGVEAPKLDAVVPKIRELTSRYASKFPGLSLWIAGHTDSVDDRAYNQGLSERRARTIAGYLRTHGIRLPMQYAGFGEDLQAVPTPDATPEPRNRRARYILSPTPPGSGVTWTVIP